MKTSLSLLVAALALGPGLSVADAKTRAQAVEERREQQRNEGNKRDYTKMSTRGRSNDDDNKKSSSSKSSSKSNSSSGSSKKSSRDHDDDDRHRSHKDWDDDDRRDYYRRHGGYNRNYYRSRYYGGYGYPGYYYRPRTSVGVVLTQPYYSQPSYYDSGYYYQQQRSYQPSYAGISVAAVQQALTAHGFNAGAPDGVSGPRTRAAISAFRRSRGLPAGTHIDDQLIYQLGLTP